MFIFHPSLIGGIVVILVLEFVMWELFRMRIGGLDFPRSVDTSAFGLFTIMRMRIFAVLHTLFLIMMLVIFHIAM